MEGGIRKKPAWLVEAVIGLSGLIIGGWLAASTPDMNKARASHSFAQNDARNVFVIEVPGWEELMFVRGDRQWRETVAKEMNGELRSASVVPEVSDDGLRLMVRDDATGTIRPYGSVVHMPSL